jgi:3-deoxy-manno-octulosonate cytidylyltransferase (CMP-KDO synthetase)
MDSAVIIPARLNSTRIKEKLLVKIYGTEIVKLTYEKAVRAGFPVYVVTDSDKLGSLFPDEVTIFENPETEVPSGMNRVCRILNRLPTHYKYLTHLQGDECFIDDTLIRESLETLRTVPKDTLVFHYRREPLGSTSSGIRVKLSPDGKRVIDANRTDFESQGFNAIRTGPMSIHRQTFEKYNSLPDTEPQIQRDIEWLKWLNHGYTIQISECNAPFTSINTIDDLNKFRT